MSNFFIIRSGGLFLMAMAYPDTGVTRWSQSKYDAVRIPSLPTARRVATKVFGEVFSFDPITGDITRME